MLEANCWLSSRTTLLATHRLFSSFPMQPHIRCFGLVLFAVLISTVYAMPTPIPAVSAPPSGPKPSLPNPDPDPAHKPITSPIVSSPDLLELDLTELPSLKVETRERHRITSTVVSALELPKDNAGARTQWIHYTDAGYTNTVDTNKVPKGKTGARKGRFPDISMFVFVLEGSKKAGASYCTELCLGWRARFNKKIGFSRIYQLDPTKAKNSLENPTEDGENSSKTFEQKPPDFASKVAKGAVAECDEVFRKMLSQEKIDDLPKLWPALKKKIDSRDDAIIREVKGYRSYYRYSNKRKGGQITQDEENGSSTPAPAPADPRTPKKAKLNAGFGEIGFITSRSL
ncbi:hypothetical protein BDP27DRAFT_1401893 [Rhodocollybia butyracea]|uniref:Uncharacterized protein n=1 Tax=Rhodocollybia butyracea TaxID=206335 RepID=A0A9P5PW92_9AGAR|nr:hypothetical protein BDP27DRAFT_1401893 [Rhodocollybia butyracea]